MSIRVLHVTEILPGGTATYLQEIYLHQAGFFGPDNLRFLLPSSQLHHVPAIPKEAIFSWRRNGRDLFSFWNLAREVRKSVKRHRPDIVHLHGTFAGIVGRLVLAARLGRPKIVYCAHGWSFVMDVSPARRKLYGFVERLLANFTDRIITVSEHERKCAIAVGIPAAKMTTVLNGVGGSDDPRRSKRIESGPIRLIFVGRDDRAKGLDILLQAMDQLGEDVVELEIVGGPLDEFGQPRPAAHLCERRNIHFAGWVDRSEVFARIAAADALVMPSRWEGFGLAAVEAFRVGTPVIASNRGGLPEVVTHGVTGFVIPLEVSALARCLGSLDRRQLRLMGEAAKVDFARRFTSKRMCAEILDVYRSVAPASFPQSSERSASP
jgi:glycosyltransferase involved in cell wall biosynthesis